MLLSLKVNCIKIRSTIIYHLNISDFLQPKPFELETMEEKCENNK